MLALFASLVLLTAIAKIKEKKLIKTGPGSRHITTLKQSILETFDIYGINPFNRNSFSLYIPWLPWVDVTQKCVLLSAKLPRYHRQVQPLSLSEVSFMSCFANVKLYFH